jgi:hypothetical protein
MACPGKTVATGLPIVTSIGSAKSPSPTTKSKSNRRTRIVDFHCPTCGETKPDYPNYRHVCQGKDDVWYQEQRRSICHECPHNRDGVCMPLRTRQPDKPCLVDVGIPMPFAECPLKKWRRVLFLCQKCGSVRFDENGVTECPTCNSRPKPKSVLIPTFSDTPATPKNDLAIVSIATGQTASSLAAITFPRFREYANFVGADFIAIRDNKVPKYPLANKFRVGTITSNYRRVLYLDADIWLRSDTGNVFDLFSPGSVWMHPDVERFPGEQWAKQQSELMGKEQGVAPNPSRVYNSGVVLFNQEHVSIWNPPPKPISTSHVSEQFWVEHQAVTLGVRDLPWEYNCQWYWPDFRDREPKAKIVHLANCPHTERMTRLERLKNADSDFA